MSDRQKEMWFELYDGIDAAKEGIRRTFRDLPEESKNNNYRPGDRILIKMHRNGVFHDMIHEAIVVNVFYRQIKNLRPHDFRNSDALSRDHLVGKMERHYRKPYDTHSKVRIVDYKIS